MTVFNACSGSVSLLAGVSNDGIRALYDELYSNAPQAAQRAQTFLREQLGRAAELPCDLPDSPEQLSSWAERHCAQVATDYADYLAERRQGAGRRYFQNKAHALYFLQRVAPTKEVDGAWLESVLHQWRDGRFEGLLTTYLEELGSGDPRQNHVLIYRKLLAEHDCHDRQGLDDEHFLQGAIQLALGQCGADFMPEVIGYNLGYEQLPLHLLISAYELRELGIDPFYFTLHVTIDNVASGHGRKAVQSLLELMPLDGGEEFYRRVALGYRLNDLGVGSTAVIKSFELEHEVIAMLERKRVFGRHMHSDYCRLEGQTVNQWLSSPGHVAGFLAAMERKGWIKHGCPPQESRFWQLIEGPTAAMFGVFNGYEKQLIHDWIAADWQGPPPRPVRQSDHDANVADDSGVAVDPERQTLQDSLSDQPLQQQLASLIPWLSANRHHRPAGLFATRRFIELRARLR